MVLLFSVGMSHINPSRMASGMGKEKEIKEEEDTLKLPRVPPSKEHTSTLIPGGVGGYAKPSYELEKVCSD